MALTYVKIASATVGAGGAASIDFTSIPSTYTDLVVQISARSSVAATFAGLSLTLNGATTNFTWRRIEGGDGTATSASGTNNGVGYINAANATANTFGTAELYIPNYTSSNNKSISSITMTEGNAANGYYIDPYALLWSNSSSINAIGLTLSGGTFVQYSTATLYGILKS